ncbi:MAG: LPS export ABC transporter ATP-binding protein [Spirochaetes bacterium]|nr:LPS export ABC transporter ATP-binding protein [Spirochaetota bacterium]
MNKIEAKNLYKKFGNKQAVDDISIEINKGEIVGLLGPNGAGKSTTFYMIVGFLKPDSGQIYINGINVSRYPMYKRARLGIGYLPQTTSIFRKMTVEDNLLSILELKKLSKKEMMYIKDKLLEEFNIKYLAKQLGENLSGGEKRRVEIARSLINEPSFILLDEPFAGVDPISVKDIQEIIKRIRDKNIGILITDHNVRETLKIVDRGYIIYRGKILIEGDSTFLINNEDARKFYLGEDFYI